MKTLLHTRIISKRHSPLSQLITNGWNSSVTQSPPAQNLKAVLTLKLVPLANGSMVMAQN